MLGGVVPRRAVPGPVPQGFLGAGAPLSSQLPLPLGPHPRGVPSSQQVWGLGSLTEDFCFPATRS